MTKGHNKDTTFGSCIVLKRNTHYEYFYEKGVVINKKKLYVYKEGDILNG